MRSLFAGVLLVLAACPHNGNTGPPLSDTQESDDPITPMQLLRDLETEVLDGYDRDEPIDKDLRVIDPRIGGARIGVGPGDVWYGDQVGLGTSRWPLTIDRTTEVDIRSKKLELHMAEDQSAAWVSDEVSWRIVTCGRTAVIPLRFTALYVRDGDRWASAVEHLSYGRDVATGDRPDFGAAFVPAVRDAAIAKVLDDQLMRILTTARPIEGLKVAPEAFALGPGVYTELHGAEIANAPLFSGAIAVEKRRIGVVERGTNLRSATVAYWIGTGLGSRQDASPVRLRITAVFERRPDGWTIAQVHASLPIDDQALAGNAFGGALQGLNPLRVQCGKR